MDNMAEQINELDAAIASLNEIHTDVTVPRNVRAKIEVIISAFKDNTEISIKVNRTLSELDEIANDVNIQSYTRMQIFNVVSLLEKL